MSTQPTQLLLEGADIESLLARVRDEYGSGVRIVSADKVRSGGVLGFFARERYAMTIEIDGTAAPGTAVPAAPVRSLADIAAAIDVAEAAYAAPAATAATLPAPHGLLGARYGAPERLPAAAALDESPAGLSTEGADFASVLAGLARAAGPADGPPPAVRPFVPARVEALGDGATVPLPVPGPVIAPVAPEPRPERIAGVEEVGRRLMALGVPAGIVAATVRELTARVPSERRERLSPGRPDADVMDVLTRAIDAALPDPPRFAGVAGDVLAVLGDGAAAYDFARVMARRLRLDPADVLLAAPSDLGTGVDAGHRITGPADARRRAARLGRGDVPTVVAVDLPFEPEAIGWAREVLDALGARTVWSLDDATRKTADVHAQLDDAGRIAALVVRGAASTSDPGGCLDLAVSRGLPTAFIDGRRGDAAGWASLLLSRLEARS